MKSNINKSHEGKFMTVKDEKTAIKTNLYTIKNFAKKNKENGTWPSTEASLWALRSGCPNNGFEKAFLCIGRRVLISELDFMAAIISQKNQ